MKSLKILTIKDGSVVRGFIDNGLFVMLYRPGHSGVGFWIDQSECHLELLKTQIQKAHAALGEKVLPDELRIKAVGDESLFKMLDEAAQAGKMSVEKKVSVQGKLEVEFSPEKSTLRFAREMAPAASVANIKNQKTRVLIVDDSTTIQSLLSKILGADPQIEVVGTSGQPTQVIELVKKLQPDVITMDIHMPEMDGVTLVRNLMQTHPVPTIMISSLSMDEGPQVLQALEYGAVDYIQKPTFQDIAHVSPIIVERVKNAAKAKIKKVGAPSASRTMIKSKEIDRRKIVAIGSSTGGTEALREIFMQMPAEIPAIVVVQHIPAVFSKAFADRLDKLCPFEVKEAADGDEIIPGRVLIAPGGTQMSVKRVGDKLIAKVDPQAAPMNRHKPSVDVLFNSVAEVLGSRAVGVILTGMGADGADGLVRMRKTGSPTIAQDESTCVVFGMPREAIKRGGAGKVSPLGAIAQDIFDNIQMKNLAKVSGEAH